MVNVIDSLVSLYDFSLLVYKNASNSVIDFVSCDIAKFTDSVQFSCSFVSNSLWPRGLQQTRPPCPSPSPRAYSQTHNHRVGDAFQPSHSLSSPSLPALNLSKHQGHFKRVSSSHQVAKVLEFQLHHQFFQEHSGLIFRMDWLDLLAVQGTL